MCKIDQDPLCPNHPPASDAARLAEGLASLDGGGVLFVTARAASGRRHCVVCALTTPSPDYAAALISHTEPGRRRRVRHVPVCRSCMAVEVLRLLAVGAADVVLRVLRVSDATPADAVRGAA